MSDPDEVKHVEHVDRGFELTVKSKRGTGTRDQDEVTISIKQADRPSSNQVENLTKHVEHVMDIRRSHQPDEEDE